MVTGPREKGTVPDGVGAFGLAKWAVIVTLADDRMEMALEESVMAGVLRVAGPDWLLQANARFCTSTEPSPVAWS